MNEILQIANSEEAGVGIHCSWCPWSSFIRFGECNAPVEKLFRELNEHIAKEHSPRDEREEFVRQLLW